MALELTPEQQAKKEESLAQIKAAYEDGVATINGKDFVFSKFTHKKRRKVWAFLSRVQSLVQRGDFQFMDWPEWDDVEKLIGDHLTVDGNSLTKCNYWDDEDNAEDYMVVMLTAMQVICYPFMKGVAGA